MVDPLGRETLYGYDALDRLTNITFEAGDVAGLSPIRSVAFAYTPNDRIARIDVARAPVEAGLPAADLIERSYDEWDRLLTETTRGQEVGYSYDTNGNRLSVDTSNGAEGPMTTTAFEYDDRDRLEYVDDGGGRVRYAYYPDGRLQVIERPGSRIDTTYTYAPGTNDLLSIVHRDGAATVASVSHTYDGNGNPVSKTETVRDALGVSSTETTTYGYDLLDRLTSHTRTDVGGTVHGTAYAYTGYNRTLETRTVDGIDTLSRTFGYDSANRLNLVMVTEAARAEPYAIEYRHDANGNLIQRTNEVDPSAEMNFGYDYQDRLVEVHEGAPGAALRVGRYAYDPSGMRTLEESGRGLVSAYYDGDRLLEERDAASGGRIGRYHHGLGLLSMEYGDASPGRHDFLPDAMGTPLALTDPSGGVDASYRHEPFGEARAKTGTTESRVGYGGHSADARTGLVYMKARYYDPDVGRFLSADRYAGRPTEPASLNRYSYAHNAPTTLHDPTGFAAEPIGGGSLGVSQVRSAYGAIGSSGAIGGAGGSQSLSAGVTSALMAYALPLGTRPELGLTGESRDGAYHLVLPELGGVVRTSPPRNVWDEIQLTLAVTGMFPILGNLADLADGVISLARGQYAAAGLSFVAMIPIVGQLATAGKLGTGAYQAARRGRAVGVKVVAAKVMRPPWPDAARFS